MSVKDLIFKVSTAPRKKSYIWKDEKPSILAFILLWSMFVCRVLSLLQWSKLIFREVGERLSRVSKDVGAKRPNVPVYWVECYYILWLTAQILIYFLVPFGTEKQWIVTAVSCYFIFESTAWVIYYTVLRRFFEEKYSINHVLEYLVVLIILIPTQALAFSNMHGLAFIDCLLGMFGIGNIEGHFFIHVLGLGFQIVVIAMIVNSFPPESVLVKTTSYKNMIIGCGDVVKKRLRPALIRRQDIISYIFATDKDEESKKYCKTAGEKKIMKEIRHYSDDETIVWIETPSDKHVDYLKVLLDEDTHCKLIVLEKPMAVSQDELDFIDDYIKKSGDDDIFFLSYYILEKALPVYMYYKINNAYKKYLDIHKSVTGKLMEEKGATFFEKLPRKEDITKITVTLHEEVPESRKWIDEAGGQACETFIHNMLIAALFAGVPERWKIDCYDRENNHLQAIAPGNSEEKRSYDVAIELDMKKGVKKYRKVVMEFADGRKLIGDFDKEALYLCENGKEKLAVNVRKKFRQKYAILTDLVARVANNECECDEVDGRINQIECLSWLIRQNNEVELKAQRKDEK